MNLDSMFHGIVEDKRMEKPFGEMLNSIVKTVPDIIYRLDSNGIITFVSDAVKKYGYSVEELIGNNILELIHPEDREKVTYRINERRTGDRSTTFLEVRLLINKRNFGPFEDRPRGAENEPIFLITAEGLYASERPETESFRGTQGIARDITERKRAEERIKQQTEFLNLVLESLPYPFYVIDAFDYTIKVANYAAHLGRLSKETTCYALTHRSDRPCGLEGHPCPLEQVKKTKRPITVEHIHYDKDGNPRNIEVHAYPILDSEGNVSRIIESSLDITERKRAEEELKKAHDELEKRVEERTAELVAANEQLRQEIEERKRAEEALQYRAKFENLVSAISTNFMSLSADEVDSGINHVLKRIGEFAGVDRSYVFQFDNKGTKMDNTHEWCAKGIEPHIQKLKGLLVDGFPWATGKLKRLETLYIPRVADLPPEASPEKKECQSKGVQSLVNVPMVSRGSIVGFLGFDSVRAEKSWAEEDMALLKTVGGIIVNTLERKRAEEEIRHLSRQLIGAMEDERRRVARDLHDELGQAVTGLHFGIEALRNSLPVELKDQETRCDELIGMVEQLGDTVRDLSSELRPDMLDHLGLIPTLEWYINDFAKRTQGLQIDFQAVGVKKRPSSEIEIVLYRILQEALNNISKHAKAKRVSVLLAYSHPKLILAIKDDGVGFEETKGMLPFGAKEQGIGLLGMRERAASVGGAIDIRSSMGKGTVIRAELPVALRKAEG